jgi:hypothetical protein
MGGGGGGGSGVAAGVAGELAEACGASLGFALESFGAPDDEGLLFPQPAASARQQSRVPTSLSFSSVMLNPLKK